MPRPPRQEILLAPETFSSKLCLQSAWSGECCLLSALSFVSKVRGVVSAVYSALQRLSALSYVSNSPACSSVTLWGAAGGGGWGGGVGVGGLDGDTFVTLGDTLAWRGVAWLM